MGSHKIFFCLALALTFSLAVHAETVLDGIAANINAAAPIAIEGIQSAAAVGITKDNNATNVDLAKIQQGTTKYQIDADASIAKLFASTGKEINQNNNDTKTQNLASNLAMVDKVQQSNYQLQHEKNRYELEMGLLQIRLAEKQRQVTNELRQTQLNYNLLSAGLIGFTTINSSTGYSNNSLRTGPREPKIGSLANMPPGLAAGSTPERRFTVARSLAQPSRILSTGYANHIPRERPLPIPAAAFVPTHQRGGQ